MVELEVNGGTVLQIEYTEGMTAGDLRGKFQSYTPGRFYRLNAWELYDPTQNRTVLSTDEIVDERRYVANVWVQAIVDENGEPIKSGLV